VIADDDVSLLLVDVLSALEGVRDAQELVGGLKKVRRKSRRLPGGFVIPYSLK
jgi:hypothetical protein